MGVYHKWKCVFVEIPKNASNAIHNALQNKTDNICNHATYLEYLNNNDIELIESYFSFAVVRNPYDRFVSAFEFCTKISKELDAALDFEEFIHKLAKKGDLGYTDFPIHFVPQNKFIVIKTISLVDQIMRFENLGEDWKKVSEKINSQRHPSFGRVSESLQVINANPSKFNKSYEDFYKEETKEIVYNLYRKDFELFDYKK